MQDKKRGSTSSFSFFAQKLPALIEPGKRILQLFFLPGEFRDPGDIREDLFPGQELIDLLVPRLQLFDPCLHTFQIILSFTKQRLLLLLLLPVQFCF